MTGGAQDRMKLNEDVVVVGVLVMALEAHG